MADKKISQLTAATTVNASDFFPIVQAGTTLQCSFSTFLSHVPGPIINVVAPEAPASGALSTSIDSSFVTSASGATNYTLAAGTNGFQKYIAAPSMGASASAVVTVTGAVGFSTITFSAAGQAVHLKFMNTGWYVLGSHGATVV